MNGYLMVKMYKSILLYITLLCSCNTSEQTFIEFKVFLDKPQTLTTANTKIIISDNIQHTDTFDLKTINKEYYTSNKRSLYSDEVINKYLDNNNIEILYIDSITNGIGSKSYLIQAENEKYWFIEFSCGSHGCGMKLTQIF